jgi:hypothetical protein
MNEQLEKEDAQVRGEMQRMGAWIDSQLPEAWRFILLCTPTGRTGRVNYVANCRRSDVIRLMYDFIEVSKATFGQHFAEEGQEEDTELGRLRQRVSELEMELNKYRTVVEPGSGKV